MSALLTFVAWTALANPRSLPFTYPTDSLPAGAAEVELYGDWTPAAALSSSTGQPVLFGATQFQVEVEYGLTDRLELGLYLTVAPSAGEEFASTPVMPDGNGLKQRLRYRLADPGDWPVDVALYAELVENQREIELEAKVLLQRRFGSIAVRLNLWGEREFYFSGQRDWVLNPTAGVSWEIRPSIHLSLDSWMRVEFPEPAPDPRPFAVGPHVYVGPALMLNPGPIWWSIAAYVRVTSLGRALQPGDAFGDMWIRSIVGISL